MSSTSEQPKTTALDPTQVRVLPLRDKRCLERFSCGERDIDYFAGKAAKWADRNRNKIFAGHLGGSPVGVGFYSLSLTVEDAAKIGTREARVFGAGAPLIYLDALGVRREFQGNGVGRVLLIDALKRAHAVSQNVAVYGVALRSLNERTTAFYERHGFGAIEAERYPMMVLPIWTLNDLFGPE
jgi:GNAT superfamily N-acetyltransferase